jgi:hypothetical protein
VANYRKYFKEYDETEWIADVIEERDDIVHGQKVKVKVYGKPKPYRNGKLIEEVADTIPARPLTEELH